MGTAGALRIGALWRWPPGPARSSTEGRVPKGDLGGGKRITLALHSNGLQAASSLRVSAKPRRHAQLLPQVIRAMALTWAGTFSRR